MRILEAHNITKSFPGVVALKNVNVAFETKKIHGIIGENGAGKSTLVKILTGIYQPDKGEILIEGKEAIDHRNNKLFEKVTFVPQELDIFQNLTVAENLFMPFRKSGFEDTFVNMGKLYRAAIPWLEKFNINVDPNNLVKNISISNQQLLQVARAFVNKYFKIIILDEPTTSLTMSGTTCLFDAIRKLKTEDKAIIFISHKLDEVFDICDEITVLRNGEKVGYSRIKDIDRRWVITKMSARDINEESTFRPKKRKTEDIILEVNELSGLGFSNINFNLHKGEILGFSGLVGAGRSEIMQTIFGLLPVKSGNVKFEGKPWKFGNTNFSIRMGLFYLPEERKRQGILPLLSVQHNIGIALIDKISNGIVISSPKERNLVEKVIDSYDIKTPTIKRQIIYLSGGNQQKVIIGRAMFCMPKILIFDEPTKGIDVGTKNDLYRMMKKIVDEEGVSIILVSSELEELLRCSNRIITVYNGEKVGEFETENTKESEILNSILGENIKNSTESIL